MFYGGILEKRFKSYKKELLKQKKTLSQPRNSNAAVLNIFEKRIDVVLYRAHFALSVRSARQLILHGHIKLNDETITNYSYGLVEGDLLSVAPGIQRKIHDNVRGSHFWPIPPKYLQVRYRTLQIAFLDKKLSTNSSLAYPYRINSYHLFRYM